MIFKSFAPLIFWGFFFSFNCSTTKKETVIVMTIATNAIFYIEMFLWAKSILNIIQFQIQLHNEVLAPLSGDSNNNE